MIARLLSSRSLLSQFLVFNLFAFLILGFFTYLYLLAIEPELINKKQAKHQNIINNIVTNLEIQKVDNNYQSLKNFLVKTKFILQEIDQIRFFNSNKELIIDTALLDIDAKSFFRTERIETLRINEELKEIAENKKLDNNIEKNYPFLKQNIGVNAFNVFTEKFKKDFLIHTTTSTLIGDRVTYITVSEISNDILLAVKERKNFVLRSFLVAVVVILIFSLFLNNYIIKPIRLLNNYAKKIAFSSAKDALDKKNEYRDDEIGNLTRSLTQMTDKLYQRIELAERFASDLTHEIRNPLASLKGASDLLNQTVDNDKKVKLLKIISNDVERIEKLITDYSQVLKDEATQSKSIPKALNLISLIESIVEDFNNDAKIQNRKILVEFENNIKKKEASIFGIESRIEQVVANLLDNAVSFSPFDTTVKVILNYEKNFYQILVKDQGPGFDEKNIHKAFDRFYSDRPNEQKGVHSGLGLNIVKNIIESHKGSIKAYNNKEQTGAIVDILIPSV